MMSFDALVRYGLLLSIWMIVLSLGVRAPAPRAAFVLRRLALLAPALAAMFVAAPAFAVTVAAFTAIPAPIKFAIVAMSVGPAPPLLPYKQMKAGGEEDYAVGLLVAASLASIVLTPLLVAVAARLLGTPAAIGPARVAQTLLLSVGLPLAAGMALRALWPKASAAVGPISQRAGGLLLLGGVLAMLAAAARDILGLFGNGAALALVATVAVGLLAGRLLGGARHGDALALAAAIRHPGVALAIAAVSYPAERRAVTAALLLYLLVAAAVTAPYVSWAGRRSAA